MLKFEGPAICFNSEQDVIDTLTSDQIQNNSDDCDEMEVGYESEEKRFYFVMFDPEDEDEK